MKIKALVTTLVLGSSSLALAEHNAPTQAPYAGPTVRDHRHPAPLPAPAPVVTAPVLTAPAPIVTAPVVQARFQLGFGHWRQPRPVLLANDTRVAGWSMINVASTTRAFTKLEVKANAGRTDLDRVLITFGNGQRQLVTLKGKQEGKINASKSLTIDLEGGARNIKSVMLIGNSGRRASIDILAS